MKIQETNLKKKDTLYYARILERTGIYEVCELSVRTVERNYFVGTDKRDKHAYLFMNDDLGKSVFYDRKDALNTVKEAEKNRRLISDEIYYEED